MYQNLLFPMRAKFLARRVFLDFITLLTLYLKLTQVLNFLLLILSALLLIFLGTKNSSVFL